MVGTFEQLPEDRAKEFDMACLDAGLAYMLAKPFTGVMFMPICFSSLMRRSTRAIYEQRMQALPAAKKRQLAAVVYNVPRSPSFSTLTQMHEILDRHFSIIDLHITDGSIEIDNVPAGTVNSVTLRLPAGDERARLAAIRARADNRIADEADSLANHMSSRVDI